MDDSSLVVDVQSVSKKFCRDLKKSLKYAASDMLGGLLKSSHPNLRLREEEFFAVHTASLQLRRGEALGLVGCNGAGKTTLLRMIAGLIRPDCGSLRTRGRVVPLLALGAGFSPVLSGRENIIVNMSLLGLPRTEIKNRIDEVIAFADLPPGALAAPVRTYSSGMVARLGFACAIHTQPDILLLDEVLAVGDMAFRTKCYRRLSQLRHGGTAFVLVSHSSQMITSVCDKAVYMKDGQVLQIGPVIDVIHRYENDLAACDKYISAVTPFQPTTHKSAGAPNDTSFKILDVYFESLNGTPVSGPSTGETTSLCVKCSCVYPTTEVGFVVLLRESRGMGEYVLNLNSQDDGQSFNFPEGVSIARLTLKYCGLLPGLYFAKIYFTRKPMYLLDVIEQFPILVTSSKLGNESRFFQLRQWDVA